MQANPLKELIFQIDPKNARALNAQEGTDILVDVAQRQILVKKPLFSLGRDIRTFRIQRQKQSLEIEGPEYEITGSSFDERLDLRVHYRIRLKAGGEQELVLALCQGENPGVELEKFLENWLDQGLNRAREGGADVYADFYQLRPELERYIETETQRTTGLELKARLMVQGDHRPQPIELEINGLTVTTQDSDHSTSLNITGRLEVADSTVAIRYQRSDLNSWLGECIRTWILDHAQLHELYFELRTSLRERLQKYLNEDVTPSIGRRVAFIRLSRVDGLSESQLPPQSQRFERTILCDIRPPNQQIEVSHVVQVKLEDLGKYLISGTPEMGPWLFEELDQITREHFFDQHYRNLLQDFSNGRTRDEITIRERLMKKAEIIGYTIQQMTSIPDLEPLRWTEGITRQVTFRSLSTQDPRVSVGLEIAFGGRIVDIFDPRLEKFLEPRKAKTFEQTLIKALEGEIQKHLHKMDPERVYMRFLRTHVAGEVPTQEHLETAARRILENSFAMDDVHVTVKPAESKITRHLEELMKTTHPLSVEVIPFRGRGTGEAVNLEINFDVVGVHARGWHAFLAKQFDDADQRINAVKDILASDIRATLSTVPPSVLQFADQSSKQLLHQVLDSCVQTVINTFGVVINFISVGRAQTTIEQAQLEQLTESVKNQKQRALEADKHFVASKLDELAKLTERKNQLVVQDPEDPDLAGIEMRISALQQELLPYPERQDHLLHLTEASESEFDPRAYQKSLQDPERARRALGPGQITEGEESNG